MSDFLCDSCKEKPKGCKRTVGKQGERYICHEYDPVIECSTCKHDGMQLVERKCLKCGVNFEFINWSLKI